MGRRDNERITVEHLIFKGGTEIRLFAESFRSVAHHLATALADARFVDLEGSGHVTYAERPDEFENAVRVFAAELDRRNTASA